MSDNMVTMTGEIVEAVRSFNRFYTRQIGLLHHGYLKSPFSLTEVRVLYELAHRAKPTAAELSKAVKLLHRSKPRRMLKSRLSWANSPRRSRTVCSRLCTPSRKFSAGPWNPKLLT